MRVKMLDLQAQYATLREEARAAIDEVCESQILTGGSVNDRFERNLASYCGVRHAITVTSGTDALLCTLMALKIGHGDEVICPAFTFFATAGSVARVGATPVFVDIDPATFNIDPAQITSRISRRTRAIMPVHLFGQMAAMEAIMEIADRHGLHVIEDAAQAIGARHNDRPATSWGRVGCLSFYPTKNLGAFGDAGAICTNDDAIADTCRQLRVHGMAPLYHHRLIGGNFRMASLQAAVLDIKLARLDGWHMQRRRVARLYDEQLAHAPITLPHIEQSNLSIYNQYVVRSDARDRLRKYLADAGVDSAIYYPIPLHLQECFAYLGHNRGDFPESERACAEVLALPIYPELPEAQAHFVCQQVLAGSREA